VYKQDRQGEKQKSDRKREEGAGLKQEKTKDRIEKETDKKDVRNNEKETKTYLVVEKGLT
jgi:hypothetical protein